MVAYDPHRHHRRSIRLKGYDYTRPGLYFVTLCTLDRACLFGEVVNGAMRLNAFGEVVRDEWFKTAEVRGYVRLDEREFVVMPNHIHGVIEIVGGRGNGGDDGVGSSVGSSAGSPVGSSVGSSAGSSVGSSAGSSVGLSVGSSVGAQRRCAPTNTEDTEDNE
ncbi:MAG: hypothetical protein SNJ67_04620, partial [Chloracidobacterium sp.]